MSSASLASIDGGNVAEPPPLLALVVVFVVPSVFTVVVVAVVESVSDSVVFLCFLLRP